MNFELTAIAYRNLSNSVLKRRLFYLKMLRSSALIFAGRIFLSTFQKMRLPIAWLFRNTIFVQYCGGENIEQCINTAREMAVLRVGALPDYSVEMQQHEQAYENTLREVLNAIELSSRSGIIEFCVFKPTALAKLDSIVDYDTENIQLQSFETRFSLIVEAAIAAGLSVLVDAEDFQYQHIVDRVTENMMRKYNKQRAVVFNTLQMYLSNRPAYLQHLIEDSAKHGYVAGIKLVRGAYLEKEKARAKSMNYPSPVFGTKEETDSAFNNALEVIMNNIGHLVLFAGTHNEKSCSILVDIIEKKGLAKNDKRVYFAQLYGMADHISNLLANDGFNVIKYIPYGKVSEVIPYMMRRIEENSSVSKQSKREIELIKKELNRRRGEKKYDNKQ